MTELQFVTVFEFICSHCQLPNEYRQAHAPEVRPHLVSTKCNGCRKLNWLGGIKGRLLVPEASSQSLDDTVLTVPEGGARVPLKKQAD